MALIPEPTAEQLRAIGVVRGYFLAAANQARTQLMTLNAFGTQGLVAAEFAQSFLGAGEMCGMVLELFAANHGVVSIALD